MTVTTRQDKVLATIERVKARIAKLQAMTEEQITKKYGVNKFWHDADIENACEQLQNNYKKLEEAKRLDAKEEEKIAKAESKADAKSALPEVLKNFENELRARFEKSWVETWEHLCSLPYPKFEDRSVRANEIRAAHREFKENILRDAAQTAEALVMNLWVRVQKKCGTVTELDGLFINQGNWMEGNAINGVVIGTKGNAHVTSILAGGYNIQRLHVRVLVK